MPSDKNNASIFFLGINDMQMEKGFMNEMLPFYVDETIY